MATDKEIAAFPYSHPVLSVALSPEGKTLASGHEDTVLLWDVGTRK
jgi:hypothetical protein